ncbi:MAG: 50S ribosomal protein L18 [Rhabdochlamydiaceae bacterium]
MNNKNRKIQRQTRVRKKAAVVTNRPRLSVYRSNNYVYAQIIDVKGNTVVGVSEKIVTKDAKAAPIERAKKVGQEIAKLALSKKIKDVAFDKGRFAFHGRVKAVAEGAREGGLNL